MYEELELFKQWKKWDMAIDRQGGHISSGSALVFLHILYRQRNFSGDILELGVRQGSGACPLAIAASEFGKPLHLVDISFQLTSPVLKDICGDANYYETTSDEFFATRDGVQAYDFIHVDAHHSYQHVYRDVLNSYEHLSEFGIICLDDFFNFYWYEVAQGFFSALKELDDDLVCLAGGFNKAYFCRKSSREFYNRQSDDLRWVDTLNILLKRSGHKGSAVQNEKPHWTDFDPTISLRHW